MLAAAVGALCVVSVRADSQRFFAIGDWGGQVMARPRSRLPLPRKNGRRGVRWAPAYRTVPLAGPVTFSPHQKSIVSQGWSIVSQGR